MGYQKIALLYNAEQRARITDKTLNISDACLKAELFDTYLKFGGKTYLNTIHSNLILIKLLLIRCLNFEILLHYY